MSEIRMQMDPLNPGHFLACCGLLELCEVLVSGSVGWFTLDRQRPRAAEFVIALRDALTLPGCIEVLRKSNVEALSHGDAKIAPVALKGIWGELTLTWWLDHTRTEASKLKMWAAHLTSLMLVTDMHRNLPALGKEYRENLFEYRVPLSRRFGLDPRSGWLTLDCGYSPDKQRQAVLTYPAVELLAAIGLQGFILHQPKNEKWAYGYRLWRTLLPLVAARAACSGILDSEKELDCMFRIILRGQGFKTFDFAHYMGRK